MDNITHTAIAAVATEFIYHTFKKEDDPKLRRNLHIASAFSSNLPDFDLLMHFVDPTSLGYLVNHRGHTHTILGLFIQLFLSMGAVLGLNKICKLNIDQEGHRLKLFLYTISFGLFSHLSLDFMNSYGIHPFWPLDNSWYYGDFVFIIEPFIWITTALVIFHIRSKPIFKYLFLTFCLSSPLIFQYAGLGSNVSSAYVYIYALLAFLYLKTSSPFETSKRGLGLIFSVICFFALQGFYTKNYLRTHLAKEGYKIIDISTHPTPGNFFCWKFLASLSDGTHFETYSGTYAFSKHILSTCPLKKTKLTNAVTPPNLDRVSWQSSYSQTLEDMRDKYHTNCRTKAWFTYARFPLFDETSLTDLRFPARGEVKSFASLPIHSEDACPVLESPWTPPRADILFLN